MRKIGAFIATLVAMSLAGTIQAAPTVTNIEGSLSKAENTCVSPAQFFQFTGFQLCSYSGGVDIASVTTSAPSLDFHNWMGPLDSGGFYPKGFLQSPATTGGFAGSTAGDGKVALVISGTISIEDFDTPQGDDDRISGTLSFGPGERGVGSSNGNAVERFDSVTHTIPATVVSSATPNATTGGFDYVIGSAGFPLLLTSAAGDFPSEEPSRATDDTVPPDFNAWADFAGGNITSATLPAFARPPLGGLIPHTVEIVSYAPGAAGGGNVEANIGVRTSAVTTGLTCESGDADADPGMTNPDPGELPEVIDDCNPDPAIGAGSTWAVSGAEFDNLILRLTTNANNRVVSAFAFYVLEYKIELLNLNDGKPGSWVGGTLSLAGATGAEDDRAKTPLNTAVDIDILNNDVGFVDDVTVTLPGGGVTDKGGMVIVNGTNPGSQADIDVTYAPPDALFEGEDTFTYIIADDFSASIPVTVSVKVTNVIAPDASVSTPEGQSIDIAVSALPGVRLGNLPVAITVTGHPSSGVVSVTGQTMTYIQALFPDSDSFDYRITDADGKSDAGTINVSISPLLQPTAVDDPSPTVEQDSSVNIDVMANDTLGSGSKAEHGIALLIKLGDPNDPANPAAGKAAISGTAVVEADNTVTYTPDPGVSGVHTFRYTLTDAGGPQGPEQSEPAKVTVTVTKSEPGLELPSDSSSAVGPWGIACLLIAVGLRRRKQHIFESSGPAMPTDLGGSSE